MTIGRLTSALLVAVAVVPQSGRRISAGSAPTRSIIAPKSQAWRSTLSNRGHTGARSAGFPEILHDMHGSSTLQPYIVGTRFDCSRAITGKTGNSLCYELRHEGKEENRRLWIEEIDYEAVTEDAA